MADDQTNDVDSGIDLEEQLDQTEGQAARTIDQSLANRPVRDVLSERLSKTNLRRKVTLWALFGILSLPFWFYVMWMAYLQGRFFSAPSRGQFGAGFLGGVLAMYILYELIQTVGGGERYLFDDVRTLFSRENVVDTVVLLVAAITMAPTAVYIYINWFSLTGGLGRATTIEYAMGVTFMLVMIYVTWRAFGLTFLAVLLAGIAYALFGQHIPGTLGHTGISPQRMVRILTLRMDGFFGFLTQLTAAWIALFLLYAGMLKAYGAFDLILRAATRSGKYLDSGVAQTAVIASAVIGSVNGSQTANAGMTGSFTIPMMKESGVKPETAGGIESVASTSGQVLPPVMGAGAFVMATLIRGVSYFDVIVAGLIPAAILMVVIVVAVHYAAAPQIKEPDMDDIFAERLTKLELAVESVKFGVPLLVLVYLLGIAQWTVMTSAFWTIVTMVLLGTTLPTLQQYYDSKSGRLSFWKFVDTLDQTYNGFREGIIVLAPVAIILAAINGVVDILMASGTPTAVSLTLMELSGGILIVAALMAMIICILLGLGMPTTAAYTIVALLIAPTLIHQFFLSDFAAHFFVFYAAILAGLTPPIATCVAVATGIAGSNFWRTSLEAIKISAPLFVLPFSFVYHPEIVDHGGAFTGGVLLTSAVILAGGLLIVHGLNYRFSLGRVKTYGLRAVFFVLGVVIMVHPSATFQYGALGVGVFLFLTQAAVGEMSPLERIRGIAAGFNSGRR